jgi:ketosteroid isomerase-like protein
VSRENVERVAAGFASLGSDLTVIFGDDAAWARAAQQFGWLFDPAFETIVRGGPAGEQRYLGLDGWRAFWRDWLGPWATYRSEADEFVDLGERVLVLVRDFGRQKGSVREVEIKGAPVWTLRDGRIVRVEVFSSRSDALKAVGLEG